MREIRLQKGWSQQNLANESGVGQDTISGIESGRHEPRPSTLRKLAAALGVEVAEFFREPALPKAETPPSPVAPEEDADEKRRAREFMAQRPSDPERITFIEHAVNILRTYYELGQRERSKMGEDLTLHGTGYVWHGFYFNALQPAMERDGVLLHASFVVDGPAEVSERERTACEKLRNYDFEMQNLVWDMRNIDNENNARVREEVSEGVAQVSEWLENLSKGAPGRRGLGEKGEAVVGVFI